MSLFLAIDVGNTHTAYGLYRKGKLLGHWKTSSLIPRTEDEMAENVHFFCKQIGKDEKNIKNVGLSSVVPNLTRTIRRMAEKYFGRESLFIVSSEIDIGMPILYKEPADVGADRLCNAVAGYQKYGGPLIIIDFGTATTFDVINNNGEYLGGVIAPGLETSATDLYKRAAQLPKVELDYPAKIIGTDTVESMKSGIMYSAVESITGVVRSIKGELNDNDVRVIATGGFADLIAIKATIIEKIEPTLVLDGIYYIFNYQTDKSAK